MSSAAANQRHVGFPTKVTRATEKNSSGAKRPGNCNQVKKPVPVSMEHVLIALRETKEEREVRIKSLFNSFDVLGKGSLDFEQIELGLAALNIPANYKYARDLLKVCDADRDGKIGYDEFRRYMDDKELELYAIFQAIDVKHHGCILPEELWLALVNAGIEIDEKELSRFVEHVDKDKDRIITFEEWRDFLLLYPHEATLQNIYEYWEKVCLVDIGEQAVIPAGIRKHLDASKYLIAGGVAGAASRTATAPLDRLKVAMQVQTTRAQIVPAFKNIWREGRFLGFFRGNGLNVMKVAPESAIRFYIYEMLKEYIVKFRGHNNSKSEIRPSERLVAGGLAGAVAQTAIYPVDLVKTRLQTFVCETGKVPSIGELSRDIWKQEGARAFYRGAVPSLLGIIPYAGIDLAAYETLKDMSRTYIHKDSEPGPLTQLGCGTVSGAFGATCVYPLQVIRTRLQAQKMNAEAAYRGMGDVFWKTLQHEGVRGFYKGMFPNLLKVIPSASITYLVYESMKKTLSLD